MHPTSFRSATCCIVLAMLVTLTFQGVARAAPADSVEAHAQRARNGGGLAIGSWNPDQLAGVRSEDLPGFQAWFEKGIDLHLSWLNSVGYWRRRSTWTTANLLTGTTRHERQTHLVPTLTSLCLYPFTKPTDRWEPFVNAGAGPVLAIQQEKSSSGTGSTGQPTAMHAGLGIRAGVGVEVRMNPEFGLRAGAHFESASYDDSLEGQRLFKGWGGDLGLTYRFQYR